MQRAMTVLEELANAPKRAWINIWSVFAIALILFGNAEPSFKTGAIIVIVLLASIARSLDFIAGHPDDEPGEEGIAAVEEPEIEPSLDVVINQIDPLKLVALVAICLVLFGSEGRFRVVNLFLIPAMYYGVKYLRSLTHDRQKPDIAEDAGAER